MRDEIAVEVNGERRLAAAGIALEAFLSQLGLDGRKVAVERNEAVVSRSLYAATTLEAGDRLEIVHFIGGG
jgi:thiamine biosynthesis protein ThiS